MTQKVTLSFCGACGELIHPAMLTETLPECENCGVEVATKLQRAEGEFTIADAHLLEIAYFSDRVSMALEQEKPNG